MSRGEKPRGPGRRSRTDQGRFIGTLLLVAGALALVRGDPFLRLLPSFFWVLLLFGAGAATWMWGRGRLPFWQRLLVYIGVGIVATATAGDFAGTAATGFIAMAFVLVYLASPRNWWALIPAGVMAGSSLVVTIETFFPRWDVGTLFLLVLAGTFTLLYLLPGARGGQRWARYPAIALIIITVIANDPSGRTPGWLVPLMLVGAGAGLLWWVRKRGG